MGGALQGARKGSVSMSPSTDTEANRACSRRAAAEGKASAGCEADCAGSALTVDEDMMWLPLYVAHGCFSKERAKEFRCRVYRLSVRGRSHVQARIVAPWGEHLEQGEPLHRLDGRRSVRARDGRGPPRRKAAARGRVSLRSRLHLRAQARDPNALDRARSPRRDVDSRAQLLASQRAALRRSAGSQ